MVTIAEAPAKTRHGFYTTPERSATMRAIRSRNTSPERALRKALWEKGIRFRKNFKLLPGKPDIAITRYRIAIFIDGEFWHGYNWEAKKARIQNNPAYWHKKIERNIQRDMETTRALTNQGWIVLRFWAQAVNKNTDGCVDEIIRVIQEQQLEMLIATGNHKDYE